MKIVAIGPSHFVAAKDELEQRIFRARAQRVEERPLRFVRHERVVLSVERKKGRLDGGDIGKRRQLTIELEIAPERAELAIEVALALDVRLAVQWNTRSTKISSPGSLTLTPRFISFVPPADSATSKVNRSSPLRSLVRMGECTPSTNS